MYRSTLAVVLLAISISVVSFGAENGSAAIESYFAGKQVIVKIVTPGTQKGVDLRFNKTTPLDWKEYSSRIKQFGSAIHKGDTVRVTTIVVKKTSLSFSLTAAASARR